METKTYKGVVQKGAHGEKDDALFIGESEYPIAEIFEDDFAGKQVTVRYWVSEEEKTKEQIKESTLRKLFGDVDAEFNDVYSDYTDYLWTHEKLKIGGHNLLNELYNHKGKYIILEVDIH